MAFSIKETSVNRHIHYHYVITSGEASCWMIVLELHERYRLNDQPVPVVHDSPPPFHDAAGHLLCRLCEWPSSRNVARRARTQDRAGLWPYWLVVARPLALLWYFGLLSPLTVGPGSR
ncbi:hypothetical protein BJY01DRAFT_204967 [Aspergillus pseudoustus]|uniref:Uncharacterized protein n=1 Tax=Aspergillus pseudoustus TaxID=1810923 RepID=A0ABR4KUF6_9EURO